MPEASDSLLQEAFKHHQAGRIAEAEPLYREILRQKPDDARALHHLGLIFQQTGRSNDALPMLRRSIEFSPGAPAYFFINLGVASRDAGFLDESLEAFERARGLAANNPAIVRELGLTLEKLGKLEAAADCYRQVINAGEQAEANRVSALQNLGSVLLQQGKRVEAAVAIDQALQLNPQYALAHMTRARLQFLEGNFQSAWREYEWRWKCSGFPVRWPNWPQALWDGSSLPGKMILLWHEQGLGDSIQFARYVPLVARRGLRVALLCPPELKTLFATLPGEPLIVLDGEPGPPFVTHAPLLSLPRIFDTRIETIPAEVPYLFADPVRVATWRDRMTKGGKPAKFRIGLVWAGNSNRGMRLTDLAPVTAIPGLEFYSLQKGERSKDVSDVPEFRMIDWTTDLQDFADTAALIDCLDLVITIDTAVAHLAGAMGKETWTLLPFVAEFRWMAEGDRSPWYPTMRLFRQQTPGDWNGVVAKLANELESRVGRATYIAKES